MASIYFERAGWVLLGILLMLCFSWWACCKKEQRIDRRKARDSAGNYPGIEESVIIGAGASRTPPPTGAPATASLNVL